MEIQPTVTVSKLIEWLSGQDGDAPVRVWTADGECEITEVWRRTAIAPVDAAVMLTIASVPMSDYPALPYAECGC